MNEHHHSPLQPVTYQLRIAGHLDAVWASWFEGMVITPLHDGTTSLTGTVADQAGLYGLLAQLRDLGLTLLAFQQFESAIDS